MVLDETMQRKRQKLKAVKCFMDGIKLEALPKAVLLGLANALDK